jgi:putative peptide zinc metalloprotease protein
LRVVVPQSRIDLVRSRTEKVEVRFAEAPDMVRSARIVRETPAARLSVPSSALTTDGGGDIPVDPKDPQRLKTLQALFILDLQLVGEHASQLIGGRAYVRFDHGVEPPVWRFGRELRQVFLSRFGV